MRKLTFTLAALAATALIVPSAAVTATAGPDHHPRKVTTVATGLDSPRGVAFLRDGTLVVAEAGHGGDVCLPGMGCLGLTGQVSAVNRKTGSHRPLVSHLASFTDPEGGAVGIDGLSARGHRFLGIMGIYPQAAAQIDCTTIKVKDCRHVVRVAKHQVGALLEFTHHGYRTIANVGAYDYRFTVENPGGATYGTEEDANPYGVLAERHAAWVADAGANTLDRVSYRGHIRIVHRFVVPDPPEPFPTDAVPTCVARSGHHLVVADLAGRIWQVRGHQASVISGPSATPYTGGPHYTGCASDRDGNVYVVSMFDGIAPGPDVATTGSVVQVTRHGTVRPVHGASGLSFPNGITVHHGALYVSVGSISPDGGIVRISR